MRSARVCIACLGSILVLMLLLRPEGLFGRRGTERV